MKMRTACGIASEWPMNTSRMHIPLAYVVRPQFSLFLCHRFLPYKMLFPGLPPVFSPAGHFPLLRKVFCGFLGGDAEEGDRAVFHDLGAAGNEIAEIRHLRYE